jgi:ribonuclease HI
MQKFEVYTDGSCTPNPGRGGYGILIRDETDTSRAFIGGEASSTNNRMEFMGVLNAIKFLPENSEATIYTDSQLVVNVLTGTWNGRATKHFLIEFKELTKNKLIHLKWVKGHNGHKDNEGCHTLATYASSISGKSNHYKGPQVNGSWGPIELRSETPNKSKLVVHVSTAKAHGKWSSNIQ